MSIQAVSNPTLPITATTSPQKQTVAKSAPLAQKSPKTALDTFTQTVAGAGAGAQTVALIGGIGAGALSYAGLKNAPVFHRVLLSTLQAGGGAAAGVVVGGLSGAVAGALSESKTGGAIAGSATGAVVGAVALTALSLKTGKAMDFKIIAGAALLGAGLGAIGGFTGAAIKN